MSQKRDILDYLSDGRCLTRREAAARGWSQGVIARLLSDGTEDTEPTLTRVAHGVLRLSSWLESDPLGSVAAAFGPDGILCYYSAARIHNLTDVPTALVPDAVAVPFSHGSRDHSTGVRVVRWHPALMAGPEVGVVPISFPGGTMRVTDPARTVVDLFRRDCVGPGVGARDGGAEEALALLRLQHETEFHKVSEYAVRLYGKDKASRILNAVSAVGEAARWTR